MTHYIHHLPGRLRIRTAVLKRDERRAEAARGALEAMKGIQRVQISTVTGSLLLHYDESALELHTLLEKTRSLGLLHGHVAAPPAGSLPVAAQQGALPSVQRVSDTFFNKLVETAIERSATALVAALI